MTRLELAIAWRYLRSRRGSRLLSFISVIAIGGMVVGVSALILIIGVINGLQSDLREKILVGSPDIRVLTYGKELHLEDWRRVLAKVRRQPGVVAAAPFVLTQALMQAGVDHAEPVAVGGLLPAGTAGAAVTTIREHATMGDFRFVTADGKRRGAVLGKLVADRLNAYPGTKVTLMTLPSPTPNPVTGGFTPVIREFEVTGVFETGMYEYDNQYAYVDLRAAQDLAGLDTSVVTGIEVRTPTRDAAPRIALSLVDSLGFPFHTVDWHEQNSSLFRALSLEKLAMSVIVGLVIMVAAFNIVSTLTMVVRDKTREIGILKAMGLPSPSVRRIFLVQGLVIGVAGTLAGLAIGVTTGWAINRYRLIALDPQIYFIDHLPVQMRAIDVVLIVILGVAIATVATLHPATQAAKLYPIDAIRSE